MMKHFFCLCTFVFLLLPMFGCNGNVSLSGRVTYSDNDEPLATGQVVFYTPTFFARGTLNPDGSYTVGSLEQSDGLPPGTYKIYIDQAIRYEGMTKVVPLIDSKFADPERSGLELNVNASTKRFDFKVDRPK